MCFDHAEETGVEPARVYTQPGFESGAAAIYRLALPEAIRSLISQLQVANLVGYESRPTRTPNEI